MNAFEINGAEINGSGQVLFPDSVASVALGAELDGSRGAYADGDAVMYMGGELVPHVRAGLSGSASMRLSAELTPIHGVGLSGHAELALEGWANGVRYTPGEGAAALALKGEGDVYVGVPLEGEAQLGMDAYSEGVRHVKATGTAHIVARATAEAYSRVRAEAVARLTLATEADVVCWVLGAANMDLRLQSYASAILGVALAGGGAMELKAEGDGRLSEDTIFRIWIEAGLDGSVSKARIGSADAYVFMDAFGYGAPATTHTGSGQARLTLKSRAQGALRVTSPEARALIAVRAAVDSRQGERVKGSGRFVLSLSASGSGSLRRYRYAEGQARIEIRAASAMFGRPAVPTTYIPAPSDRYMTVPAPRRERRV